MTTLIVTHDACLEHETPDGHPERVDRLRAVLAVLDSDEFSDLPRLEAPVAPREALLRAHLPAHIDAIESAAPSEGLVALDADTWMSPGSLEAARRAAGAVIAAIDAVMSGSSDNAFCAVRPPGHHAERHRAMGFCLFSSAAVGALHALEAHGLERVAIVDFDVHHGNGTEDVVAEDPRVFFASSHQWPLYPGTGGPHDARPETVLDLCLDPGAGSEAFRAAYAETIGPALRAFAPQLILISAGFDAHRADPLAQMELDEDDFAWVTDLICEIAAEICDGRVVSTLEGGYDLGALARSTAAHLRALARRNGSAT